jgi:transcriptional regulator with XRE-family HTH domain
MTFGAKLRFFREQSIDPDTDKRLTQQKLAELVGYTAAAISDWELNKSKINADERRLLTSIVKILKDHHGIKTPKEANLLLESGNFRALNKQEMENLFPDHQAESEPPPTPQNPSILQFLFKAVNFDPNEYQIMFEKAREGPAPYWPRIVVSLINKFSNSLTPSSLPKLMLWLWIIWLSSEYFIEPSLRLNLGSREDALKTMVYYAVGSLIIPPLIAGMTNTRNNPFWIRQNMQGSTILRLYVHQGAYVGYHAGYYFVLLISLLQGLLGISLTDWLELIKTILPLAVSLAGAQLVPYNLWLAYSRLWFKDGGIFFVFVVLGPLWAVFFIKSYELFSSLTPGVYLAALTIMAMWEVLRTNNKVSTTK